MICFKRIILGLLFLGSFLFTIALTLYKYDVIGIIVFAGFALIFFLLFMGFSIKSIKMSQIEIKLNEVQKTLDEVKQLSEFLSKLSVELIQTNGRFHGKDSDDRNYEMFEDLKKLLKTLQFQDKKIDELTSRWHYWIEGDYIRAILASGGIPSDIPVDLKPKWHDTVREFKKHGIRPDKLREIFATFEILTTENQGFISDYEFYLKYKSHRDFESWKNRYSWIKK